MNVAVRQNNQDEQFAESLDNKVALAVFDLRRSISRLFELTHNPKARDLLIREHKNIEEAQYDLALVNQRVWGS